MRTSKIAYPNLRAEMSRKNIGLVEMAEGVNSNRDTLARKLSNKSKLTLADAFSIQQQFFPELDVTYLFASQGVEGRA